MQSQKYLLSGPVQKRFPKLCSTVAIFHSAEKGKEGDNRNKADKGRNKYHNNRKPNGPREKQVENPSENPIKKGANEKTQPQN